MNKQFEMPQVEPAAKAGSADMLPEYDFSSGVRGKYALRYRAGVEILVSEETSANADTSLTDTSLTEQLPCAAE